jgi:phage terminase large subunit-like protein
MSQTATENPQPPAATTPVTDDAARARGDVWLLKEVGAMPDAQIEAYCDRLPEKALQNIGWNWRNLARQTQLPPDGDWDSWLILAGRGFGKTRAGAGWVHECAAPVSARVPAKAGASDAGKMPPSDVRIALIGATLADARAVMVEGESGLLATAPPDQPLRFEPSLRRVLWPNGAQALLYSAEEPETLRGPQFHYAWGDEAARWSYGATTLANLRMGLRLGEKPRLLLTTTPKPLPWLKALIADAACSVARGRTFDNEGNLPRAFIRAVLRDYGGTRLGRQELDGELIEEVEGALWTRATFEDQRVRTAPALVRVVVAVDPPASSGPSADACGIVAVGLGADGRAYVLGDCSVQGASPDNWARAVVAAADTYGADKVVVEVNNGGDMVVQVLRAVDAGIPVKPVHAARGKVARAEPVASLYAAGKVSHVGVLPTLEDELCGMVVGGSYAGPGRSPDRADAAVWALTELMLQGRSAGPRVRSV